jgi:hypothetical protein
MTLKSNYYASEDLDRLSRLATSTARTEASLVREAPHDLFGKHRGDALSLGGGMTGALT